MTTNWRYLPILKWKQGEQIALRSLKPAQWAGVVPLIELLQVGPISDASTLSELVSEYADDVSEYLNKHFPDDVSVAIDVRYVAPSYLRQSHLLALVCSRIQKKVAVNIIPVLADYMMSDSPKDIGLMAKFDQYILRLQTPIVTHAQVKPLVDAAVASGLSKRDTHLVIDQYAIVGEDPAARFMVTKGYLDEAVSSGCASVTVAGGSFPMNLIGYKQGVHDIGRVEWKIWERVRAHAGYSAIRYADYAVTNPAPAPVMDPREMNPSVAIRYAADGVWRLYKAGGFKRGKPKQYQGLCQLLLMDAIYSGAHFSYGDQCYEHASTGKLGNGNPSSWRRDATNHHVVLTRSML